MKRSKAPEQLLWGPLVFVKCVHLCYMYRLWLLVRDEPCVKCQNVSQKITYMITA